MRYYVSLVMRVGVPNIVTNVRCSPSQFTNLARAGAYACTLLKLNPAMEFWVCDFKGQPLLKAEI
jgi:hypothetical protein